MDNKPVTPHIFSSNSAIAVNCFSYETMDFLNHVLDHSNSFIIDSTRALDNIENTLNLLELKLNSIETTEGSTVQNTQTTNAQPTTTNIPPPPPPPTNIPPPPPPPPLVNNPSVQPTIIQPQPTIIQPQPTIIQPQPTIIQPQPTIIQPQQSPNIEPPSQPSPNIESSQNIEQTTNIEPPPQPTTVN